MATDFGFDEWKIGLSAREKRISLAYAKIVNALTNLIFQWCLAWVLLNALDDIVNNWEKLTIKIFYFNRYLENKIYSSFVIRHSSFVIRHSSFVIRHSSFIIHHSSSIIHHPSSIIHHPSSIIHHSPFIIHHSYFI